MQTNQATSDRDLSFPNSPSEIREMTPAIGSCLTRIEDNGRIAGQLNRRSTNFVPVVQESPALDNSSREVESSLSITNIFRSSSSPAAMISSSPESIHSSTPSPFSMDDHPSPPPFAHSAGGTGEEFVSSLPSTATITAHSNSSSLLGSLNNPRPRGRPSKKAYVKQEGSSSLPKSASPTIHASQDRLLQTAREIKDLQLQMDISLAIMNANQSAVSRATPQPSPAPMIAQHPSSVTQSPAVPARFSSSQAAMVRDSSPASNQQMSREDQQRLYHCAMVSSGQDCVIQ